MTLKIHHDHQLPNKRLMEELYGDQADTIIKQIQPEQTTRTEIIGILARLQAGRKEQFQGLAR